MSSFPPWDKDIGERLRSLEDVPGAQNGDLEQMFAQVCGQCADEDKSVGGFLRSRPTAIRRLIAFIAFAGILVVAVLTKPLPDGAITGAWIASSAAFVALLVVTLFAAIRPLYVATLPRTTGYLLGALTIAATVAAALLPLADAHASSGGSLPHPSVCLGMGLLIGLPVYALLRIIDRGNPLGGLVAAAAAGLGGNLFLQMHCPTGDSTHLLMGHATVAIMFVMGLGIVHWLLPSKTL